MSQESLSLSRERQVGGEGLVVREVRSEGEEEVLYRTTALVFSDPADEAALETATACWRTEVEDARDCYGAHLRAAFEEQTYVGSDVIYERQLRLGTRGEAALRTAGIGVVLAHPDHRLKGIGRALMQDAVRYAREQEFALLLLGGIPNFYHRFGYVDVMERTGVTFERAPIGELPDLGDVTVRPATEADAPALLALYERHYGAHPGGFVRTIEGQRRLLRAGTAGQEYALAADRDGQPCGYVKLRAHEAGADTWKAASALLRHHAQHLDGVAKAAGTTAATNTLERPATFTWQVPPGSHTHYLLAEHLPLVSEVQSRPRAGWLARPAHLPTLFRSMVAALESRWYRAAMAWSGILTLHLAGDGAPDQEAGTCTLELAPGRLAMATAESTAPRANGEGRAHGRGRAERSSQLAGANPGHQPDSVTVHLLPGAFTQLLFGFRPVWWIAEQPGNEVPEAVRGVLAALFPAEPAWVAATDGF